MVASRMWELLNPEGNGPFLAEDPSKENTVRVLQKALLWLWVDLTYTSSSFQEAQGFFLGPTQMENKNQLKHSLLTTKRSLCIPQSDIGKLVHERSLMVQSQVLRNDVSYKVDLFPSVPYNTKVEWVVKKWTWLGRVVQWQLKLSQYLSMAQGQILIYTPQPYY